MPPLIRTFMRRFWCSLVTLFATGIVVSSCSAQSTAHCYTFLLKGDVWLSCEAQTSQLTKRGDIGDFAINNEPAQFAYSTERLVKPGSIMPEYSATALFVDLASGRERTIRDAGDLLASCGTLLTIKYPTSTPAVRNAATGEEVRFSPYVLFRCSSDRQKVIGLTSAGKGAIMEGTPPQQEIAPEAAWSFNISPSGSKVAYKGDNKLCVVSGQQKSRTCIDANVLGGDPPAVNNDGEVLVEQGTAEECYFRGSRYFSAKPFKRCSSRGQCAGIGYWRPGLNSIQILQRLGAEPQWATPATAQLLLRWAHAIGKPRRESPPSLR